MHLCAKNNLVVLLACIVIKCKVFNIVWFFSITHVGLAKYQLEIPVYVFVYSSQLYVYQESV